jgi:DNA-binding transcriptional MerR regulator
MKIGELAESLGVSTKTLRFYETIGLLPRPRRSDNGYRVYSPAAVSRARKIVALRRLELPIPAIATFFEQNSEADLRGSIIGLIDERLRDYQLQIAVLQGKEEDLRSRLAMFLREPFGDATDEITRLIDHLGDRRKPATGKRSRRNASARTGLTLP